MSTKYVIMPASTSPYSTTTRRRRFNANDPKYRCCCGSRCHVRTGSLFIGAAEIIIIGLFMITASVWFVQDGHREAHERRYGLYRARYHDPTSGDDPESTPQFIFTRWSIIWLSICLVAGVVFLFTVALLFVGIVRERRWLFIPHMAAQILVIIAFGALAGYSAVLAVIAADALFSGDDDQQSQAAVDDDRRKSLAIKRLVLRCLQTAACLMVSILFAAFFAIVYRCYNYFRDASAYEKNQRQISATSSPNSTLGRQQTIKLLYA